MVFVGKDWLEQEVHQQKVLLKVQTAVKKSREKRGWLFPGKDPPPQGES